jgi:hypothetical protein
MKTGEKLRTKRFKNGKGKKVEAGGRDMAPPNG